MQFNCIKLTRDEFTNGEHAFRNYKLTLFGIPIYRAYYRTTNKQAVGLLNTVKQKKPVVGGFAKTENEI